MTCGLNAGDFQLANTQFQSAAGTLSSDFLNALFKYFVENEVEFFRAPYLAYAQVTPAAVLN